MEQTRPYWKVIVSLFFSVLATILVVVLGLRLLLFFMPFVVGWILATIANPLVCLLEKRLKITKKFGSVLMIIAVLALIVGGVYLGTHKLVVEVGSLVEHLPEIYEDLEESVSDIVENLSGIIQLLPEEVRSTDSQWFGEIDETLGKWAAKLGEPTVEVAGNIAKRIPSILVSTIVTIVSAYFFIAEREEVVKWFQKITPKAIKDRVILIISNFKRAIGGYFKAQLKIMFVVGVILFIGFLIMGIHYAALLAIVIAFLDFLPFFGTGTALVPWTIYQLLMKDYRTAVMMLVLYAITQVVRQMIQPKLVGDGVGLRPLPTLVFLYIGYKVGSILGMIFAVPVGMILLNMYQAGAFDYILDDVKILIKGILSLRK